MGDQGKKARAEKQAMDAVADMAGHIAHDFNNLLTPLIAYPDLIRMDIPADARAHELLNVVSKAAEDMAAIARQLLTASGRSQFSPEKVDLNELVTAAVEQCTSEYDAEDVTLETALDESVPQVEGNAEPLIDLLHQLCSNAIESEASLVTVSTAAVELDRTVGRFRTADSGNYLRLAVTDNGKGMDKDGLSRSFDAFYTTKTKNAVRRTGLGLGLSVAYGIVSNHGALIETDSTAGEGTTVAVYFSLEAAPCTATPLSRLESGQEPVAASESEPVVESSDGPRRSAVSEQPAESSSTGDSAAPSNGNSILIVDDEGGIRRLFQTILSTAFPETRIDVAGDGAEAVDAFRSVRYGVVLMDLHMPVMDGTTAFHEMAGLSRENDWRMPSVVFCTGFAPPVAVKEIVNHEDTHCLLTKPVSGDDLITAVRDRLVKSRE